MPVASKKKSTKTVRRVLIVNGADPFPPSGLPPLDIDPRIDMTKPIYEQVLKLWAKDKAKEAKRVARLKRPASQEI